MLSRVDGRACCRAASYRRRYMRWDHMFELNRAYGFQFGRPLVARFSTDDLKERNPCRYFHSELAAVLAILPACALAISLRICRSWPHYCPPATSDWLRDGAHCIQRSFTWSSESMPVHTMKPPMNWRQSRLKVNFIFYFWQPLLPFWRSALPS